jgi:hypothetical protein
MGGIKSLLGDTPYQPYGGKPPARAGNPTQQAAAESVAYVVPTVREKVYLCIKAAGEHGRINNEIVADLGLKLQTVCARVAELRLSGRVQDSGIRRKTDTGRDAIVWRAT